MRSLRWPPGVRHGPARRSFVYPDPDGSSVRRRPPGRCTPQWSRWAWVGTRCSPALIAPWPRPFLRLSARWSSASSISTSSPEPVDRSDGSVPLLAWLKNAAYLAGKSPKSGVFLEAIAQVNAALGVGTKAPVPLPSYRDAGYARAGRGAVARAGAQGSAGGCGGLGGSGDAAILELRRKLREGGQLRRGIRWASTRCSRCWAGRLCDGVEGLRSGGAGDGGGEGAAGDAGRGCRPSGAVFPWCADDGRARLSGGGEALSAAEEDEGFHFFVMEHIEGDDLQRAVMKGRLSAERALPVILSVGGGAVGGAREGSDSPGCEAGEHPP